MCVHCNPPQDLLQIILLDESSDRERVVYRPLTVNLGGTLVSLKESFDEIAVVTLPTKKWRSTPVLT